VKKLIQDHRKQFGEFEVIDFVDEDEIRKLRESVDVDAPLAVHWTWEYGSEVAELRALYEKGKVHQWNAETDLDWSLPCSNDEWLMNPRASMLAQVLSMMGRDEATQKAAMFDEMNYVLSQLLHGEQAALQLCGQLTNVCEKMDEKWYAASQVVDEARHIEAFSKLMQRKMGTIHPIGPTLKILLEVLLETKTQQQKVLGMQCLFEGMAVGIMDMFRSECRNALLTEILRRVEQDEARLRRADDAARGAGGGARADGGHGGLGVQHPRGSQRQPTARHAAPARPEVRHRPRERHEDGRGASELRRVQQPGLHAHRDPEPPEPGPHHGAHSG
jgi:hypothetical protein